MKTTLIIIITLILAILISSDILFAQLPGLPDDPDQAPIDGGLGLLAVAGGAYAWKKIKSRKE
jgi:hypothetical protein